MRLLCPLVALVLAAAPQETPPAEPRDAYSAVVAKYFSSNKRMRMFPFERLIEKLAIKPGSTVADVGCGAGHISFILAHAVGPKGRVICEDIEETYALNPARQLMKDHGVKNVKIVKGEVADPKLPQRGVDAVLVVNAYHEFQEHKKMLDHFRRALKPGGRLVIVDKAPSEGASNDDEQLATHNLTLSLAESEIRAAGFEVIDRESAFIDQPGEEKQWLLVATMRGKAR
jgi:ubiquinone/menaquinone biosynthesis C-methylase UbiE